MEVSPAHLVMALPLHAVTQIYGEGGIRQRFALEIARFSVPVRRRLEDALLLAADLHRDDQSTPNTHLSHLLRTTVRVASYYEVDDDEVLIATLLQDTVDCHAPELATTELAVGGPTAVELNAAVMEYAALDALARRFGSRVAHLVRAVTDPPPRQAGFGHYHGHIAEELDAQPWVRVIKVSDFVDHEAELAHRIPDSQLVPLATQYRPLVPVFRELVSRMDTPLSSHVKAHILRHLDGADRRLAAILTAA